MWQCRCRLLATRGRELMWSRQHGDMEPGGPFDLALDAITCRTRSQRTRGR